jgi:hypothetical protein
MEICKHDLPIDRCGLCGNTRSKSSGPLIVLPDHVDVVIVAGGPIGYEEYLKHSAYVGHGNRPFKKECRWMAFYADGEIKTEVAEVLHIESGVRFSAEEVEVRASRGDELQVKIANLMSKLLRTHKREPGQILDVVLLSGARDSRTKVLDRLILNDKESKGGRVIGISQGQWRYTSLEALSSGVRTTTALGL